MLYAPTTPESCMFRYRRCIWSPLRALEWREEGKRPAFTSLAARCVKPVTRGSSRNDGVKVRDITTRRYPWFCCSCCLWQYAPRGRIDVRIGVDGTKNPVADGQRFCVHEQIIAFAFAPEKISAPGTHQLSETSKAALVLRRRRCRITPVFAGFIEPVRAGGVDRASGLRFVRRQQHYTELDKSKRKHRTATHQRRLLYKMPGEQAVWRRFLSERQMASAAFCRAVM